MPRPSGGSTNGGYKQKKKMGTPGKEKPMVRRKFNGRDYHGKKIKK